MRLGRKADFPLSGCVYRHSLAVGSNDRYPKNKRPRNGRLRTLVVKFLLPLKNSLFFKIVFLLICVGNFVKSRCSTVVSCNEIGFRGPRIAKFPVNFPVSRELPPETGSYLTASATIQSSRTAETVVDRKDAVSAGIVPPIFNVPSLRREYW